LCLIEYNQNSVKINDKNTFQFAIESPRKDQIISSQRTIGAFMIFENNSSVERPPIPLEVQLWGPSHHFCSMPE
jgi:hypothetical protein